MARPPKDRRGAPKGTFGNPPHVPTDQQREFVRAAAGCGMPHESIGKHLKLSADTLTRHYSEELENAAEEANAKVAGTMFKMATDPNHKDAQRAGQFWLMSRAGWRTQTETNLTFGSGVEEGPHDDSHVKPSKITVEFIGTRPKGLPGCAPEDR